MPVPVPGGDHRRQAAGEAVRGRGVVVALSWAPHWDATAILARLRARLTQRGAPLSVFSGATCALLLDDVASAFLTRTPGGSAVAVLSRSPWRPAASVDVARVPIVAAAPGPFAALWLHSQENAVRLAVDPCGLQHVYQVRGDDWCAVSSSASVLADASASGLDWTSLATYGLLGHLLESQTPFRTVTKVAAGARITLSDGRLSTVAADHGWAPGRAGDDLVAAGVTATRAAVRACLDAAPDAGLELSGGFDSRLVLAAMPAALRIDRLALTLGDDDAEDVRIAAGIAGANALAWRAVSLDGMRDHDDATTLERAEQLSAVRDFSGDGLSYSVLDWAERLLGGGPRLTGQNGELARGFYYPGQPDLRSPGPWAAAALLRWRLTSNHAVDTAVLASSARDELLGTVKAAATRALRRYDGPWLAATDRFYLDQRMQRWVGLDFSSAAPDRCILAPFFHEEYIAWSLSAPPRAKRGNRLFAQVLQALDPALAGTALQGRRPPVRYAAPGPRDRADDAIRFARKLERRLRRTGSGAGRPPVGAGDVAAAVRRAWAARPDLLQSAMEQPELDHDVVAAIAEGRRWASVATVAFLLNVNGAANLVRESGAR